MTHGLRYGMLVTCPVCGTRIDPLVVKVDELLMCPRLTCRQTFTPEAALPSLGTLQMPDRFWMTSRL